MRMAGEGGYEAVQMRAVAEESGVALGTTSPAAIEHKLEVDTQFRALVVTALGPDRGPDADGIARVIGHVWSSALSRWVSGIAPDESVQAELTHAARMLVAAPARV